MLLGSLTLLLAYNVALQQFRWFLLLKMRCPTPQPPHAGWRVGVATTFVPGAESLGMLEVTVQALVTMAYPHDTWVLDEGDDPQVQALCTRLGARHFSRKSVAHYQMAQGRFQARSKHGNYNAWLTEHGFAHYDLIVNIDPDHVPASTFLLEVVGYFDDPQIGYVQAAQAYYNQGASFVARGAAEETYAYYAVTQMASYALGFPIVTGCHTTHRVTALQQVGGFAPHDADDLLITFFYRVAGWQGVIAGHCLPGLLHLWTAGIVLASIALMATDWWPFPAPYDRRLWERQARGGAYTRTASLDARASIQRRAQCSSLLSSNSRPRVISGDPTRYR